MHCRPSRRGFLALLPIAAAVILACGSAGEREAETAGSGVPGVELRIPEESRAELGLLEPFYASIMDPARQRTEPFRIFDNLYYVGIQWVSAYVLETSAGLVLIDSLHPPYVEWIPDSMRRLGLDPADVEFVLVTHGHFDHVGGARFFQDRYGAEVVMTGPDWELAQAQAVIPGIAFEMPERGVVARDATTLTVGDTEIRLFITPGHTPGVLSIEFPVRDGDRWHRAFVVGGGGTNFSGLEQARQYVASVERLRTLGGGDPPVEVNLANHPFFNQLFERRLRLSFQTEGGPHPFVDPDGFRAYLSALRERGQAKLVEEGGAD